MQALAIAVILFAISAVTEYFGFERDLAPLREAAATGLGAVAYHMIYAIIVVGFYEEILFRGLIMNRIAHMFGATTLASSLAALLQGALFGLSHMHQGLYGVFYMGALAFCWRLYSSSMAAISGRLFSVMVFTTPHVFCIFTFRKTASSSPANRHSAAAARMRAIRSSAIDGH